MRSKSLARQIGKRRGLAHQLEEVVLAPAVRRALGDDLLREDVEGQVRRVHRIERAAPHSGEQRGALDQLVPGHRIEPALRRATTAVTGATDALQECRDAARRGDLAHHLDRADVDAQLERRGRHQRAQLAGTQLRFDTLTPVPGEAAVVGRHRVVAEALGKQMRDALGHAPRVDEDERGAVGANVRRDGVEHLAELLARRHGLELTRRQLDGDIERAPVADIDDRAARTAVRIAARRARADEQPRDGFDGSLRRGQTDAHRARAHSRSRRSSVTARCEPRLSRATAWISSTMMVVTVVSAARLRCAVTSR